MDAIAKPGGLGYEARFSAPLFDLPGRSTELLRSLHGELGTRFSISPGDMHVWGGASLADVRLRVDMFGERGRIEVTVDKLLCDFDNLLTASDIAICQDCIVASERVIQESWPDMNFEFASMNLNYTVELGNGIDSASDYLSRVTAPGISLDLKEIDGAVKRQGIRLEIENEKGKWRVFITSDPRIGEKKSIFVSISAMFGSDSAVQGVEKRVDLLKRLVDLYFKGIGLNVSVYSSNSV